MLPGISTEQLRSRLNRMVADGLLSRERFREVPPRVDYELTEQAKQLLPVVSALARWGAHWIWDAPGDDEEIDIGAILRSLPGFEAPPDLSGVVEFCVLTESLECAYTVMASEGHLTVGERAVHPPEARIRGPQAAWVGALSPDGDTSGLQIEGDDALAASFVAMIAAGAVKNASIR